MVQKDRLGVADADPSPSRRRSKSPSPSRKKKTAAAKASSAPPPYEEVVRPITKPLQFVEDVDPAVKDNDIFMLPSSDFSLLVILTILAVFVRLFRIYQPSSVVFDEVQ